MKRSDYNLTPRLLEVVRLTTLGCNLHQIGAILGISPNTADNHRTRAMKTLGVKRTATLVRIALQLRITTLQDKLTTAETRKINKMKSGKKKAA